MTETRICLYCKGEFKPNRKDKRCCSNLCASRNYYTSGSIIVRDQTRADKLMEKRLSFDEKKQIGYLVLKVKAQKYWATDLDLFKLINCYDWIRPNTTIHHTNQEKTFEDMFYVVARFWSRLEKKPI